jgi:hypothetical protein
MNGNLPSRIVHGLGIITVLLSLCIVFAARATDQSWEQKDWKEWTARDVQTILTKSSWVSTCCREWNVAATANVNDDPAASLGYTGTIVSSELIRQALVRSVQLDRHYQTLDAEHRENADEAIAACLNEKFDRYIIISFSFNFGPDPKFDLVNSSEIHLLTSDGRKIVGQVVTSPISWKCGSLQSETIQRTVATPSADPGRYGSHHELAFLRVVDGTPTIGLDDKKIRVELDFSAARSWPGHSHPEIDFSIDKLIYKGKVDF